MTEKQIEEQIEEKIPSVKISVRKLVEFILRSGDIAPGKGGLADMTAMQEGSRIHRKIQKSMGVEYRAEVPLSICVPITKNKFSFEIEIEGRADGIIDTEERCTIDEIKGIYMDLDFLEVPIMVHQAQAMCYAYIYGLEQKKEEMEVQITYCNLETEDIRRFQERFTLQELEKFFTDLVHAYGEWVYYHLQWIRKRNASIKEMDFPFPYRPGQKDLVEGVYRTILRKKRLYIEAPTGVGKTISTVFPTVKAMGEEIVERIFYLTAKTITRTVAEETFALLAKEKGKLKVLTLTAKEKICAKEKAECNPVYCERAKGHYDRVNAAVFELLQNEENIDRKLIEDYAEKHQVCPFEMALDVAIWADVVICDYNYVFDPNVYLRRFFDKKDTGAVFLIDEAHNLVERGREMYSASLYKEDFLAMKKIFKKVSKKITRALELCNKDLLELKRECDEFEVQENIDLFARHLMQLMERIEAYMMRTRLVPVEEEILSFYFSIRQFFMIYEWLDDKYTIYTDYTEDGKFHIRLQCMDPSSNLEMCLDKGRSAVFFSATLLPIKYYREQLAGREEDYAIYAPSPFKQENRLLMIASDVSTKYTRRTETEFQKIAEYISGFVKAKMGNYMVFFPSYKMLGQVQAYLQDDVTYLVQETSMREEEKEKFLSAFTEQTEEIQETKVGLCVMGGIFGEGIDLKEDSLIGAVLVGTGLPMVCNEKELFRNYYQERNGQGFDYAYLYQGMNKVLQAAGRVIRTDTDRGAILLLDERFLQRQYQNLFPREWSSFKVVNGKTMADKLDEFWNNGGRYV